MLHDALNDPPPTKPTWWALGVQLCSPVFLFGKSLYDLLGLLAALRKPGDLDYKIVWLSMLSAAFMLVSFAATALLVKAFADAHASRKPTYDRAKLWVQWRRHEEKLDKWDKSPPPRPDTPQADATN